MLIVPDAHDGHDAVLRLSRFLRSKKGSPPAVTLCVAGVHAKVLVGGKLGGIDVDGDHDGIALGLRDRDERQVPSVQVAHGRHEAYFPALFSEAARKASHRLLVCDDLHPI